MSAFFGSYGLYALDWDGKLRWQTDLGDMMNKHGHGEVIWEQGGLSANIVASPVAGDGMVFAGSSYEK